GPPIYLRCPICPRGPRGAGAGVPRSPGSVRLPFRARRQAGESIGNGALDGRPAPRSPAALFTGLDEFKGRGGELRIDGADPEDFRHVAVVGQHETAHASSLRPAHRLLERDELFGEVRWIEFGRPHHERNGGGDETWQGGTFGVT